MDKVRNSRTL